MIDRPLNILIVASWYPSSHSLTEGSFVEEQADLLVSKGHHVTVLHPYLTGTFKNSLGQKRSIKFTNEKGKQILRVGVPPILPGMRGLTYYYCFLSCLDALKKNSLEVSNFDIVHSHAIFMAGCIGTWISRKYKISQIHTEHASGLIFNPKQYSKYDQRLITRVYKNSKHVLFVSNFAKYETFRTIHLKNLDNVEVLPNLVSKPFFESNFKENPLPLKFLNIGNFIPVKNHKLLLMAWAEFQIKYPEAQLTLVGEGPLLNEIKPLVNSEGLSNVNFVPRQGRQGILHQIENHHVVVSSSTVETFGLSIAEAQAMGKPVVVTDSGGVRDIVEPETGIITKQTVEDFANGLIEIQKNYETYSPQVIRKNTHDKFSSEKIYQQLLSYYKEAIN